MITLPFKYEPFCLIEKNEKLFIKHPGAVVIVMVDEEGKIAFVSQHRPVIDEITLELPAGKIEEGESVEDAVYREAIEETGFVAENIKHLLSFQPDSNITDETLSVFICQKGEMVGQDLDDDEFIKPSFLSLKKAISLLKKGEINDLKTVIALGYAFSNSEIEFNNSISDKICYNREQILNKITSRELVMAPNFCKVDFIMPDGVTNYKYYLKEDDENLSFSLMQDKIVFRKIKDGKYIGSFYPSFALTDKKINLYKGDFEDGEECSDSALLLISSLLSLLF